MKKLLTAILFLVIIGIQNVAAVEFKLNDYPKDFKKGWNLITFDYWDPLLITGELKYAYIFDPLLQRYAGGDISDPDSINTKNFRDAIKIISGHNTDVNRRDYLGFSLFVYLENDVNHIIGKNLNGGLETPANSLYLFRGWNFIANLKEFMGKSFNDFKGSCTIERAYAFDNSQNKWVNIDFLMSEDDFDGGYNEIGMGIIVKVSETCSFKFTQNSIPPPVPSIPVEPLPDPESRTIEVS